MFKNFCGGCGENPQLYIAEFGAKQLPSTVYTSYHHKQQVPSKNPYHKYMPAGYHPHQPIKSIFTSSYQVEHQNESSLQSRATSHHQYQPSVQQFTPHTRYKTTSQKNTSLIDALHHSHFRSSVHSYTEDKASNHNKHPLIQSPTYEELVLENKQLKQSIEHYYKPMKTTIDKLLQEKEERDYLISHLQWKVKQLASQVGKK